MLRMEGVCVICSLRYKLLDLEYCSFAIKSPNAKDL